MNKKRDLVLKSLFFIFAITNWSLNENWLKSYLTSTLFGLMPLENIDNILSLLELAARVNFDLEGRTLVVRED